MNKATFKKTVTSTKLCIFAHQILSKRLGKSITWFLSKIGALGYTLIIFITSLKEALNGTSANHLSDSWGAITKRSPLGQQGSTALLKSTVSRSVPVACIRTRSEFRVAGHECYMGTAALSDGDYVHAMMAHADLLIVVGHDVVEKPPFFMHHTDTRQVIHASYYTAVVSSRCTKPYRTKPYHQNRHHVLQCTGEM